MGGECYSSSLTTFQIESRDLISSWEYNPLFLSGSMNLKSWHWNLKMGNHSKMKVETWVKVEEFIETECQQDFISKVIWIFSWVQQSRWTQLQQTLLLCCEYQCKIFLLPKLTGHYFEGRNWGLHCSHYWSSSFNLKCHFLFALAFKFCPERK